MGKREEVEAELRKRIHNGHYPAGSELPSQHDLGRELDVARETIRAVLQRLAAAGMIVIRPKQPAVVRERAGVSLVAGGDAITWAQRLGGNGTDRVVEAAREPAGELVAQRLGLELGAEVVRRVRHQVRDGELVVVVAQWVPGWLADRVRERAGVDLEATGDVGDLFALFQHAGWPGDHLVETHYARTATEEEARTFGLSLTAPMLITTRVTFDVNGDPVEYSTMPSRADRTALSSEHRVDRRPV